MAGYKKLFDIRIKHEFYSDKACKGLSIIPTQYTQNIFHKVDLVYTYTRFGITVSYNTDFTHSLIAYLEDDIKFSFRIKSKDPFFYNYTDLEHENGKSLYFDSKLAREQEGVSFLFIGDYVTSLDEKSINDQIFNNTLERHDRILVPIGIIIINLLDLIPNNEIGKFFSPKKFDINFNSRLTYWRYNLIQNNEIEYDELLILDNNQIVGFSKSEQVHLSNGKVAMQIMSNQPILLQEFSDSHFQLKGIKDGQDKILIAKLNVSDVKQVVKEKEKIISELYVYY